MITQTKKGEEKIRIGIMCNGFLFEKWKAEAIKYLLSEPSIEIALLVIDSRKKTNTPLLKKITHYPFNYLLWRIYKRYWHKPEAMELVSLEDKLNKVPSLNCEVTTRGKFSEYFNDYEIEKIKGHNLDVLIRFGFNIIRGEILNSAKHGVWSYHHSDENIFRGGPPGFWEIYHNHHCTGVVLQRLTPELDNGIILRKGYYKTIKKSCTHNVNQVLMESAEWIKQVCINIKNGIPIEQYKAQSTAAVKSFPGNIEMLSYVLKKLAHTWLFHYRELFSAEKWNIGLAKGNAESLLQNGIEQAKWLPPSDRGEYRADPFGYLFNDHLCIIHEKYDYAQQKGWIEIQRSNEESTIAIESSKHLSYPYIFSHNHNLYCVPESYQKNCIELYRLSKGNNKWEFENVLADNIRAVDSSLCYYNKKWWLFCTKEDNNPNTHLYIYYSDSLNKRFIPHQNNPVKTDVQSARPAGNIFTINDTLYRPAQDCSKSYGWRLVMNKIEKLNEKEFLETAVKTIKPDKKWNYNKGIHTINFAGEHILFDAKKYEFNWYNFTVKLKKKIGIRPK